MTVEYSTFKDMVAQDQVEMVQFDNSENILHIVLQDGCTYTAEDGTVYTKSTDADGNAVYTFTDHCLLYTSWRRSGKYGCFKTSRRKTSM